MHHDMDPLDYSMLLAAQKPKKKGQWLQKRRPWGPCRIIVIFFFSILFGIVGWNLLLTILGIRR